MMERQGAILREIWNVYVHSRTEMPDPSHVYALYGRGRLKSHRLAPWTI